MSAPHGLHSQAGAPHAAHTLSLLGAVPFVPPMTQMAFSLTAPSNLRHQPVGKQCIGGHVGLCQAHARVHAHVPHVQERVQQRIKHALHQARSPHALGSRHVQQELWVVLVAPKRRRRRPRPLVPRPEHVAAGARGLLIEAPHLQPHKCTCIPQVGAAAESACPVSSPQI